MKYIIIKKFGPGVDGWQDYARWAKIENCREYYSIDAINRERFSKPESSKYWENCVNKDFKIHLLTNLDFAKKIISDSPNAEIVGVIENPKSSDETIPPGHTLVGYDILDRYNDISLLTNCGSEDNNIKNLKLNKYALIDDLNYAYGLKEMLRKDFPDDDHAENCEVWAVYKIKN